MQRSYSLKELAVSVQEFCIEHRIKPANAQAANQISERNIRYYRLLGILDEPEGGYIKSYTEMHRLQLLAIRYFQSVGTPLRQIKKHIGGKTEADLRELIYGTAKAELQKLVHGKTEADLQDLIRKQLQTVFPALTSRPALSIEERWRVMTLSEDFQLISRKGNSLPSGVLDRIREILHTAQNNSAVEPPKNQGLNI